MKMTRQQFDQCKLPKRLDFKTVEAAKLVLVHEIKIKDALVLAGMNQAGDAGKLSEAIKMFEFCVTQTLNQDKIKPTFK